MISERQSWENFFIALFFTLDEIGETCFLAFGDSPKTRMRRHKQHGQALVRVQPVTGLRRDQSLCHMLMVAGGSRLSATSRPRPLPRPSGPFFPKLPFVIPQTASASFFLGLDSCMDDSGKRLPHKLGHLQQCICSDSRTQLAAKGSRMNHPRELLGVARRLPHHFSPTFRFS